MKKFPQCDTYVDEKKRVKKKPVQKRKLSVQENTPILDEEEEYITVTPQRPKNIRNPPSEHLIPITDFMSYEAYSDLAAKVKEHGKDCKVTFRKTVVQEIIVEAPDLDRMREVLSALRPAAMTSLQTLEPGKDLDKIVLNVMEQVHASALNPEHHSIVLSDSSRNSSRMYTRDPTTKECDWNFHPKALALGVLNQHGPNMVSLLLDDAVEKLCDGTFIRDYTDRTEKGLSIKPKDQLPCVYLNSNDEDYVLILHYDEDAMFYALEEDDNTPIKVEYILIEDVFVCDETFQGRVLDLRQSINNRKHEVLNKLKSLMINDKVLINFLHSIQPMKLQSLKNIELCKNGVTAE